MANVRHRIGPVCSTKPEAGRRPRVMAMCLKGTNRMFEEEKPILGNESSPQQIATFKNTIIPSNRKGLQFPVSSRLRFAI
jgi:hypothetical protein